MNEHTAMNVAKCLRSQTAAGPKGDRQDEVKEHADRQQDLERKHGGEAAFEGSRQDIAIALGHGDAGRIKDGEDEWHEAAEAASHLDRDLSHLVPA